MRVMRMTEAHLGAVAELERLCFGEPWSENALRLLLGDMAIGFVCLEETRVAAYGGMLLAPDEGQVTNVAVHPDYRRRGLAKAIMNAIDIFATENGIVYLSLEVREKNAAARSLYASCGWCEVGIRKNFYSKPCDNAVVMIKDFTKGN